MSRPLICPCGSEFYPNIFKDEIQVLCDSCVVSHYKGRADIAPCWIADVSVLPLVVTRPAVSVWPSGWLARATESRVWGSARGSDVRDLTAAGPFSPGARRG